MTQISTGAIQKVTPYPQNIMNVPRYLETLLVLAVFGVTAFLLVSAIENPVVLHVYYVPVVLTGFFGGAYRARMMSLFCILTATTVFLPAFNEVIDGGETLGTILAFMLWSSTLVLISFLVGSLSDGWRDAMQELRTAHEKDGLTDPLTTAANRRAFEYELTRRLAQWNRDKTPLSLVMLDIDHFKNFNDRYGHQAGDTVLKEVVKTLRKTVREVDLVARYGGEEFGLVIAGADIDAVKDITERARNLIEASRFPHRGLTLRVTASFGVATVNTNEEISSLIQRCDAALYCSKEAGRNCAHFHNGTTSQSFGQGMTTESVDSIGDAATAPSADVYTDDITGLPTQKVFFEEFRRRTLETRRYSGELAVTLIAIDGLLKDDIHDVRMQKSLLATISRLVGSVLRETDLIARYDANSLSILMPATSLERSLIPLKRLSRDAAGYSDVQYPKLSYSVSIGVADVMDGESPGASLRRVELALDASIAAGGDSLCFHNGTDCVFIRSDEVVPEIVR